MQAIVYTKYGPPDILEIKEVEKPTPKGIYVATGGSMAQIFQPMLIGSWLSMTGGKKNG